MLSFPPRRRSKIALDEYRLGTKMDGVPDGHVGLYARSLQFVGFGDDASALIAQHANGLTLQEATADALGVYVAG